MKKSWIIIVVIAAAVFGVYYSSISEKSKNTTSNGAKTEVKINNGQLKQDNDNVASKVDSKTDNHVKQPSKEGNNGTSPGKTINKPKFKPNIDSDEAIIGDFKEIELIHNNLKSNNKMTKSQYSAFLKKFCYTKEYSEMTAEKEWDKDIFLSNYTEVKVINKNDKETTLKALDKGKVSKWVNVSMFKIEGRWLVSKIK